MTRPPEPVLQEGPENAAVGMPAPADLSVIVVAYNSRDEIGACLAALRAQTRPPAEILVLENGSAPDRRVDPAHLGPDVRYVDTGSNLGYAGANNMGAGLAKSAWLAFLNPDAFPEPDWIEEVEAALVRYPDTRIFGSLQLDARDSERLDGAGDVYHASGLFWRGGRGAPAEQAPEADGTAFSACGAAMVVEASLFRRLGGFDEAFFCYAEDVDLGYRARLAGEGVVQLTGARVRHVGEASSRRSWDVAVHHNTRNRLWLFVQNTPWPLLVVTAPLHVVATLVELVRSVRRGRARAFFSGLAAGLSDLRRVLEVRRRRQKERKVSAWQIAAALNWSPDLLRRRTLDVRPLPNPTQEPAP